MPKRLPILILLVAVFAYTGCRRKTEPVDSPPLPSLWITMSSVQWDSVLIDYGNKVAAEALFLDARGDTLFQGRLSYFKTRGNSALLEEKKPFAIKFPKKQVFEGLDRGKSFVLLANAMDESHIRNAIGLDLARAMGLPAPRYTYITLYVNGIYKGLYQMTNKVDVGKDALDITDLDKLNEQVNPKPMEEYEWFGLGREKSVVQRKGVLLDHNPDDITGGYLLDVVGPPQHYMKSLSGFVSAAKDNVRVKSPQYASMQEIDYIVERYNKMETAVHAPDGFHPETGRHYSDYMDVESFARYYLLNEILFNWDGGWASFMMYKERDNIDPKFYAGPAWDYDRTLDNPRITNRRIGSNEIRVDEKQGNTGIAFSGGLLYHLCQHEDFMQTVRDCYANEIGTVFHSFMDSFPFDSLVALLSMEADRDNSVFEYRDSKDYKTAVDRTATFLRDRIAFFDWYFASPKEEHVKITVDQGDGNKRKFYYPTETSIEAPILSNTLYNHDPVYELYFAGTDSIVPKGIVLHEPQTLELRGREPTHREVQIRRVRKKLAKMGIHF